ncbi:PAS domain-containing protein [Parasulfitobacter algicola]|uniref:PAS domain-containing protein n=1 Tax=Parasulfitobacter algicola TaxID=2614809 RepID=A0ABX2IK21_9RHOB|nr:PAS domain-containing protein [Sulfitobacter algicola]NSX53193.1 PAS domain-containing protein [Sulfitobacter algicola]
MTEVENIIHKAIVDSIVLDSVGENLPSFVLAHLKATPDCVKVLEKNGRISFMSENGMCAMEIDDFSHVRNKVWWDLWPNESQDLLMNAFQGALSGATIEFEACCPTAMGRSRCWQVTVSPILDCVGNVESVLAVSRDITGVCTEFNPCAGCNCSYEAA